MPEGLKAACSVVAWVGDSDAVVLQSEDGVLLYNNGALFTADRKKWHGLTPPFSTAPFGFGVWSGEKATRCCE